MSDLSNETTPQAIAAALQQAIEDRLKPRNMDLVDIIPIPRHGDRMVRLRTLEEALSEFDSGDDSGSIGYLVQLKPSRPRSEISAELEALAPPKGSAKTTTDGIYSQDGKLNAPFLLRNAELLLESADYVLARNIYKALLQAGDRPALGHLGLARCYEAENRLDEARAHYEESIAYHATLEAYQRLAGLLVRQKKDREAADTFSRALHLKELTPNQKFELHQSCANAFSRANAAEQARFHYERALELSPSADDLRCNIGFLCMKANQTAEAKRHFQDAIASNPRNDKALFGLGSCLLSEGDKRGAHDHFARSLDLQLNNPTAVFHLVKCAYEIKSFATAARILEEYIEVAPVNANLLYSLAGLQFHLGRRDEARLTAERILTLSAGHAGAKELLAMIDA